MRGKRGFKFHFMTLFVFLMCGFAIQAMAEPVATLPSGLAAQPGGQVVVPIELSGSSGQGIDGFTLRLDYDTGVLSNPEALTSGTLTQGISITETIPPTDGIGEYSAAVFSGFSPSSDGTLMNVQFDVSPSFTGSTAIQIVSDNDKSEFHAAGFVGITSTFVDGSLDVQCPADASFTANGSTATEITIIRDAALQFIATGQSTGLSWDFDYQGGAPNEDSTAVNPTFPNNGTTGDYVVLLTATDPSTCTDQRQITVHVMDCDAQAAFADPGTVAALTVVKGEAITFNNTSTGDAVTGGTASWIWAFQDGGASQQKNPTYSFPTLGTKTVGLTATGTGCSTIATRDIEVVCGVSDASFTVAPNPPTVLQTVTFMDTSTAYSVPGMNLYYQWDFGDGVGTSTEQNPTYTYTTSGSKTVSLTVTANVNGYTCQQFSSQTINVQAACDASASFTMNPSNGSITVGDSIAFDQTVTGAIGSPIWDYYGDGSVTDTVEDPTFQYTKAGDFTVTLTATGTTPAGCSSIATGTVHVACDSTASITANPTTITEGESVSFTGSGTGYTTYEWDFGDGTAKVTDTLTPTHTFASPGTYTVTLTVTSTAYGCTASDTQQIQVNPECDAVAVLNGSLGQDGVVIFDTTGSNSPGGALMFDYGDGQTGTAEAHAYSVAGTYTVTLTATGSQPNCTAQDSQAFSVTPPPDQSCSAVSKFTATTNELTATFDTTGSSGTLSFDYGDSTTGTSKTHTYSKAGTYTVTLTATGTGSSGSCTRVSYESVTVSSTTVCDAVAAISATTDGLTATFSTNGSSSPGGALMFDYGDNTTGTSTTHTYSTAGTFTVEVTATGTGGCVKKSSTQVTVSSSSGTCNAVSMFTATTSGLSATFDSTGSVGDLLYQYGDNTTGSSSSHTYAAGGVYTVTLIATGNGGCTSTSNRQITVTAPSCDAAAVFGYVTSGLTVTFNPEGSSGSLEFNYGDGNVGGAYTHTYSAAGTYLVTLTASGDSGCTDTQTKSVSVSADEFILHSPVAGMEDVTIGIREISNVDQILSFEIIHPDNMTVPSDTTVPVGFVHFELTPDDSSLPVVVEIFFSEAMSQEAIWKLYEMANAIMEDYPGVYVEFSSDMKSVQITLFDGGIGDMDNIAGRITDVSGYVTVDLGPGPGPGKTSEDNCFISSISANDHTRGMIAALAFLTALVGSLFMVRRKRK